ncbi:Retinoic acid induced 16-like protein-domain-containing protein [Gamsiella multidivaricata]|uniref:Retinoic acid induced 16-like protein-domain-containing protein n=1 Tax=Gamsiella multidivaricata TaxID=101098 RepID=UPI00221FA51B|nr:Retinoic acid induced 16-like protein-domain-containing protein [Gamsiella multidivaricata]KAI7829805.1 Retinoic acid induced 16-like protein-domain-containing protein [Gamsiella multidivaricata]
MVDLLVDEESGLEDTAGTTGVCMEHLLKNNVLAKLVNVCADGDQPHGIIGETIRTMAAMINLLDDRFLVHNAVHMPTVKLLRTCCAPGAELEGNESYHEDLIDLMYILCSKIHGYPELLNIFFCDKQWLTTPERVAERLQKSRETIALLKSLSQQPNLALSSLDFNPPSIDATSSLTVLQTSEQPTSAAKTAVTEVEEQQTSLFADTSNTPASKLHEPTGNQTLKRSHEFLLFTYLSKFVHREGKAGDFARTGLLFLTELATGSLGEYILDSEFPTYLTAGVGALYSQLPRQLIVKGSPNDLNSSSTFSADNTSSTETAIRASRRANIELSTSADFQSRLDAFLKVLEFCQDVLVRCPNTEIAATLLASFKSVFLESILYPSILECSDTDGSSVAVISYIDQILQVIEHEALVDLVVGFLMESDEEDSRSKESEDTDAFAEVQNPQTTSPYFTALGRFTLKDLILSRLKSRSQPTVIATLKLLNTIITRHCKYSLKLLNVQPENRANALREQAANRFAQDPYRDIPMINHHAHELDLFFALVATINPRNTQDVFACGYDAYLRDAEASVETHQCLNRAKNDDTQQAANGTMSEAERKKQRRRSMKYGHRMDLSGDKAADAFGQNQEKNSGTKAVSDRCGKGPGHTMQMHRLLPSDPLLQSLLGALSHFFAHTVELNLALTGVITSLAICPYRSLEGWLLFRTSDVKKPDVDRDSGDESDNESPITGSHIFARLDPTFHSAATYDSDDEDSLPFFAQAGSGGPSLPLGPPSFKSFPPFFTMLRTLTQQVDYYRSEIDGFDEYLIERRRELLHLSDSNTSAAQPTVFIDKVPTSSNPFNLGAMYASSESFFTAPGSFDGGPRPSTSTTPVSSPNLLSGSFTSSRPHDNGGDSGAGSRGTSSALQDSNPKTSIQGNVANPVTTVKISTSRPRKSSSPSSLMSTPSNMPFLVAAGIGGKRNVKSNSASPLASGTSTLGPRYPSAPPGHKDGSDNQEGSSSASTVASSAYPLSRTATASHEPVSQQWTPWTTADNAATASPKQPVIVRGMATAVRGTSNSSNSVLSSSADNSSISSSSMSIYGQTLFGTHETSQLAKAMNTMTIKPLFADGFIDDSDYEAEADSEMRMSLSEDDNENEDEEDARGGGNNSSSRARVSSAQVVIMDMLARSHLRQPLDPNLRRRRGRRSSKRRRRLH